MVKHFEIRTALTVFFIFHLLMLLRITIIIKFHICRIENPPRNTLGKVGKAVMSIMEL